MKRGEVWTAAGGGDYADKPRPIVVVQDDRFEATASITVCGITSNPQEAELVRVALKPTATNGLQRDSHIMTDKLITLPRNKLRKRIGRLSDEDILRLNRALLVFLGLAG